MFYPSRDINVLHSLIRTDATILDLMGLSESSSLTIAKHILKTSRYDNLATDEIRLCVYIRNTRNIQNEISIGCTVQIDCHVPSKYEYKANDILKRCKEILHKYNLYNRPLHFRGMYGDLPSMPGFYCGAIVFEYFHTI